MATLTEKQEAIKAVLGSTEAIRKFVQEEDIHLEELRTYISNLSSVVTALEEEKKQEAIDSVKSKLEAFRAELALSGLNQTEINNILGIGKTPSGEKPKKGESKAEVKKVQYKFVWTKEDGSEGSATRGTKGPLHDAEMKAYMKSKGYFAKDIKGNVIFEDGVEKTSLQAWVNAEGLEPV